MLVTQWVASKLMGIVLLWLALYINTSVKFASRLLKILLIMKVLSLSLIIAGGFYWMGVYGVSNLENSFQGERLVLKNKIRFSRATASWYKLWLHACDDNQLLMQCRQLPQDMSSIRLCTLYCGIIFFSHEKNHQQDLFIICKNITPIIMMIDGR